jgi:hypothetical protein
MRVGTITTTNDRTDAVIEREGTLRRRNKVRGKGVDERVSDWASAAVGATLGLYHIIQRHATRGARNKETFWKRYGRLEAAKKELNYGRVRKGARARCRHDRHPGSNSKLGQG